jgi:Protein of unknown function (DUF3592)
MFIFMVLPISIFAGLMCAVIEAFSVYRVHKKYKNAVWKQVLGSIIQSRVDDSNLDGTLIFTPDIKFAYTYNNTSYTSNVIAADLHKIGWVNRKIAEKWVVIFPKSTTVNVYVDSNNPVTAVLFPEYRFQWNKVPFAFCTAFGLSMIIFLLLILGVELFRSEFIQKIFS